jgi:hypothetical protein
VEPIDVWRKHIMREVRKERGRRREMGRKHIMREVRKERSRRREMERKRKDSCGMMRYKVGSNHIMGEERKERMETIDVWSWEGSGRIVLA